MNLTNELCGARADLLTEIDELDYVDTALTVFDL